MYGLAVMQTISSFTSICTEFFSQGLFYWAVKQQILVSGNQCKILLKYWKGLGRRTSISEDRANTIYKTNGLYKVANMYLNDSSRILILTACPVATR